VRASIYGQNKLGGYMKNQSKLETWLNQHLECPDCNTKLGGVFRELQYPKDYYYCQKCKAVWRLAIEKGLALKPVYGGKSNDPKILLSMDEYLDKAE
jgi:hypothetical protein